MIAVIQRVSDRRLASASSKGSPAPAVPQLHHNGNGNGQRVNGDATRDDFITGLAAMVWCNLRLRELDEPQAESAQLR